MSAASKRRRRAIATCQAKKRYRSPDTAVRKALVLTDFHKPTWAYQCPVCGDYHLTTRRRRANG